MGGVQLKPPPPAACVNVQAPLSQNSNPERRQSALDWHVRQSFVPLHTTSSPHGAWSHAPFPSHSSLNHVLEAASQCMTHGLNASPKPESMGPHVPGRAVVCCPLHVMHCAAQSTSQQKPCEQ
jgi:hypothetical protein